MGLVNPLSDEKNMKWCRKSRWIDLNLFRMNRIFKILKFFLTYTLTFTYPVKVTIARVQIMSNEKKNHYAGWIDNEQTLNKTNIDKLCIYWQNTNCKSLTRTPVVFRNQCAAQIYIDKLQKVQKTAADYKCVTCRIWLLAFHVYSSDKAKLKQGLFLSFLSMPLTGWI